MRSNFICIFFIGIVFDAVWLQRLCFFLSDFFEFGRFQKIFSFFTKIIIKTNLLCCPAPFLQYRFCGSAFCRVYSASVLRFAFLPHLFSFALSVCFFCCFFLFPFLVFCFSDSVYLAFFVCFFCYVSFAALFLLCFPERKKS